MAIALSANKKIITLRFKNKQPCKRIYYRNNIDS